MCSCTEWGTAMDRYREVVPATDHLAELPSPPFGGPEFPGAIVVTADKGWTFLSVIYKDKHLGVYLSRDEVTRLYDVLSEVERHLWREEREAAE